MTTQDSYIKFKNDHDVRSQSNKDMLYFFGASKEPFKKDLENTRYLFNKIIEYFNGKVRIKEKNKFIKPTKITFHEVFGWVVYGETSKSYLGKCSINGNVNIEIGNSSYLSGTCEINGNKNISIGSFTSIANGVEFFSSNINHPLSFATTFNLHSNSRLVEDGKNIFLPNFNKKINNLKNKSSISIGNDVWIGRDVMIMPGITIPNGCVIGAKSIVTKDCEPYGVYVGSPAKLIKFRFNTIIIDQLQEIEWWNWSFEKIRTNSKFFDTNLMTFNKRLNTIIE